MRSREFGYLNPVLRRVLAPSDRGPSNNTEYVADRLKPALA